MSVGATGEAGGTPPPSGMPVEGDTCWKIARADRASIIVDAADYFRHARAAMLLAKRRIMLIGWDFDARIEIAPGPGDDGPARVGDFITWLLERNPQLHIYLLRWDIGALKTLLHATTLRTLIQWGKQRRMHPRLDSRHPTGASHHQKLIVIDDALAFAGGIDMTANRWDTRAHRDDDPGRVLPDGKVGIPWHDAAWVVDGAVAARLGELCRARWLKSGAKRLVAAVRDPEPLWPPDCPVDFESVEVAVSRTLPQLPDELPTLEIEKLCLVQIAAARRHLYIESQYFASRKVAEAIARRLAEPDPPEIVIMQPQSAEGWLQSAAMDSARARLIETLKRHDHASRLAVYMPYTAAGVPIYVHAKIMIADDRILRIGSSNVNNRSMRLDTECDLTIDAELTPHAAMRGCITEIRDALIAEHLGVAVAVVTAELARRDGSLIATIEALRGEGKTVRPYETPDLSNVQKWLADNEVLDPEGPGEMFEPLSQRGLFRGRLGRMRTRLNAASRRQIT